MWPVALGILEATSHTRLRARDHYTSSTLIGGKGGADPSLLHTMLHIVWTNGVCAMQDGCEVYMDSYMASNGSCFILTWIVLKNHLLEVGLTWNWEIVALQILTSIGLFCFIMCEDPREQKFIAIAFGWGPGQIWLHTTLEDPWPHCMILEVCLGQRLHTFLWALTISWSQLLARVWSGP